MKPSTTAIFTLATIVGLGTTVWTVATTEPAKVELVDDLSAATAGVIQQPNLIDSWNRVARALTRQDAPIAMAIDAWLTDLGEERAEELGAESMIWYAASNVLAQREDRFMADFTLPPAVAARKKAIDLLLKLSQTSPERMRYWHWNSLAWAWVRSGQFRSARGALERTEAALRELPDDYPASEIPMAIVRLANCWGSDGIGDRDEKVRAYLFGEELLLKYGERWSIRERRDDPRIAYNTVELSTLIGATGDEATEAAMLERSLERYRSEMATEDRRAAWFSVLNLHDKGLLYEINPDSVDVDAWMEALAMLAMEIEEHGQRGDMNWNRIGWSYWHARREDSAREAWGNWLAIQKAAAAAEEDSPRALYNLACGLSLVGDTDGALETLSRAVDAGWIDLDQTQGDRDFGFIVHDERFRAILQRISQKRDELYESQRTRQAPTLLRPPAIR